MKKIYFATTNKDKLKEARNILGVNVVGCGIEIDEVQSLDPIDVATKKGRAYFKNLNKPIFVEDISLKIHAFNGLPGTLIDSFMKTLGNKGIVSLLNSKRDRKAEASATIVYIPKRGIEKVFVGKVEGNISEKPKGEGFGWDPIFIPKGEKRTFGEMTLSEKNKYSMRAKALNKLKNYLENVKK